MPKNRYLQRRNVDESKHSPACLSELLLISKREKFTARLGTEQFRCLEMSFFLQMQRKNRCENITSLKLIESESRLNISSFECTTGNRLQFRFILFEVFLHHFFFNVLFTFPAIERFVHSFFRSPYACWPGVIMLGNYTFYYDPLSHSYYWLLLHAFVFSSMAHIIAFRSRNNDLFCIDEERVHDNDNDIKYNIRCFLYAHGKNITRHCSGMKRNPA